MLIDSIKSLKTNNIILESMTITDDNITDIFYLSMSSAKNLRNL